MILTLVFVLHWFLIYNVFFTSHIISNRCGLSINTWRWTMVFSAGFVFITMPTGWIGNNPLYIFIHFSNPIWPLVYSHFGYYYFQVKYTNMHACVHIRTARADERLSTREKTYDIFFIFFLSTPDNSIVILRPNDFFISVNFKTTIIPNCY